MSTDTHYHDQPHTLDPTKPDLTGDEPLAQGHDREKAAAVAEADAEHTAQVKAEEGQDEVTARDPGDHAKKASKKKDG